VRPGILCLLVLVAAAEAQERPLRGLRIRSAQAAQRTRQRGLEGMTVSVVVETSGFKGSDLGVEVRLVDLQDGPIRTPRGTPRAYRDDRGRSRVAETKPVKGENSCETSFALFFPYAALVPPGPRERRIGVRVSARCSGLSGFAVFGAFLPPLGPPPVVPGLRIESVALKAEDRGVVVRMRLDGGTLRRGRLEAGVRMRTPSGTAVRVRPTAPPELTGPRGMLDCRGSWDLGPPGASGVPVRLFVPYEALDLPAGEELSLALSAFARVSGWRALQEQEIRITVPGADETRPDDPPPFGGEDGTSGGDDARQDDEQKREEPPEPVESPESVDPPDPVEPPDPVDPPKGGDPPERDEPTPELRVVHPSVEELSSSYRGRSGSYGMESNLLRLEAIAVGLKEGVHCLEVDLGPAGRRYVWARAVPGAAETAFAAMLPVPCGSFQVRLSVEGLDAEGVAAAEGEMAPHTWAPSQGELEEWSGALEKWRKQGEVDADSRGFVVSTLAQIAGGYLLRGEYDRAAQTCKECLELCEGADDGEQRAEIDRIRITLCMLRSDVSALDTLYAERIERETDPLRRAGLYREWAERRAVLEPDPSKARELWRRAQQQTSETTAEQPPPPAWFE
jgi:hypothetical protein